MGKAKETERETAQQLVVSLIGRCEKVQPKFAPGTAQHSLLENRLRALRLCRALLQEPENAARCPQEELERALPPVASILHKCGKAQAKYAPGQPAYTRLGNILNAMELSQELLLQALEKRGAPRPAPAGEQAR